MSASISHLLNIVEWMQSLSLSLSHTHTQRKHGESQRFDYEVCGSEHQDKQTHQGTSSTTFLLLKISAAL